MTTFMARGASFLVENIIWNRISAENPQSLYKYYDIFRMVRRVVERAENEIGVKVYDYEVMDFTAKEDSEWSFGWGLGLENPGSQYANVYVCYMAIEIDDMDNIIFPGDDVKSDQNDSFANIMAVNEAIAASFNKRSMSDWEFEEKLEEIVQTNVATVGAIKSDGKKYRTFKWITVRGWPNT